MAIGASLNLPDRFNRAEPGFHPDEHSTIKRHGTNRKIVCHRVIKSLLSLGLPDDIGEGTPTGNDQAVMFCQRLQPRAQSCGSGKASTKLNNPAD